MTAHASRGRILIVGDEEGIRHLLARLVRREGYEPLEAADGNEALAAIRREAPDAVLLDVKMPGLDGMGGPEGVGLAHQLSPDLVLMDLVMPGMNGLQATRQIKAQPVPRVVMVTLHDHVEYRRAASAARAHGFIPKAQFGDSPRGD